MALKAKMQEKILKRHYSVIEGSVCNRLSTNTIMTSKSIQKKKKNF